MWWHGLRCVAIKTGTRGERVMWKRRSCHDWWSEAGWGASFLFFFSIPIQLQSEAVEAVKHCLAHLHTQIHTNHKKCTSGQTKWTRKKYPWIKVNLCRKWLNASKWNVPFCTKLYSCIYKNHEPRGCWEFKVMEPVTWSGVAHSGSDHFPNRNMVGKGSITSHC